MVAIINAIVGGSVFFCEKVGFEKGAQKGPPSLSFGVPQMGRGPPKVVSVGAAVKTYSFFTIWPFGEKASFSKLRARKKRGF